MHCKSIQRNGEFAVSWSLEKRHAGSERQKDGEGDAKKHDDSNDESEDSVAGCEELPIAPSAEQQEAAGERCWGPGLLWQPTVLLMKQQDKASGLARHKLAGAEELGTAWAAFGPEICWAHNGTRQNGWIHLGNAGQLDSKWGVGTWRLLARGERSPLMLVTFHGVEHALRLMDSAAVEFPHGEFRFDVVSIRRTSFGQMSLAADSCGSQALEPGAPAVCTTQGWPKPKETAPLHG